MFGWLFGKRKSDKTGAKRVEKTLEFDQVPDGKYIVKFEEENASPGQFVVASVRVQYGEHEGSLIPCVFNEKRAQDIARRNSGEWLSRLSFEGNKKAERLEDAMSYANADSNGEFLINVKDGRVSSIPEHEHESVEGMRRKLAKSQPSSC